MARKAVVTGGTRGIGAAISIALKDAGHDVVANFAGNAEAAKAFTESSENCGPPGSDRERNATRFKP